MKLSLIEAEEEQNTLNDSITRLDDISFSILRREIKALRILNSLLEDQAIALDNPNFI
jgi:hypothetical protein